MERNLRELTMASMLEKGVVEFYYRDVDYDKLEDWEYDMSIDIELDYALKREQELSDMIQELVLDILKVSDRLVKPLKNIKFFDYEGVTIYFTDGSYTELNNKIVLKGVYKFFKEICDYRKKDIYINNFKSTSEWEIGLKKYFDDRDMRIHCGDFLLQAVIELIENALIDEYIDEYIG